MYRVLETLPGRWATRGIESFRDFDRKHEAAPYPKRFPNFSGKCAMCAMHFFCKIRHITMTCRRYGT